MHNFDEFVDSDRKNFVIFHKFFVYFSNCFSVYNQAFCPLLAMVKKRSSLADELLAMSVGLLLPLYEHPGR